MLRFVALLSLVLALVAPLAVSAQSDIPLVVIRYNQKRVYYDTQLYNAAQRALQIKPSVQFSLVSFVPQLGNTRQQDRQRQQAERQTGKLVSDLNAMGIPGERIAVTREFVTDARHHEVYLYVD